MTIDAPAVFYGNNVSAVITLPEDATGDANITIGNKNLQWKTCQRVKLLRYTKFSYREILMLLQFTLVIKKIYNKTINTTFTVTGNTVTK